MATPIGYTLASLLCGNLPDLTTAAIRSIVTADDGEDQNKFLADIAASADNYTSNIYSTQFIRDTGPTFTSLSGVYLSAASTSFNAITSTIYDGSTTYYIYNYVDTGDVNTSNIISYQSSTTPIQGLTFYKINNDKLIFFSDTGIRSSYTYRYFNELLLEGNIGNLNDNVVGVALLSTSHVLNINNTSYTDISGHVVATTVIPTYVDYTSYTASLKTQTSFHDFTPLSAGSVGSVVFYLSPSDVPQNRTLICAISGSQVNYTTTIGQDVYLRLFENTILNIS
jgi:hypothetical protein